MANGPRCRLRLLLTQSTDQSALKTDTQAGTRHTDVHVTGTVFPGLAKPMPRRTFNTGLRGHEALCRAAAVSLAKVRRADRKAPFPNTRRAVKPRAQTAVKRPFRTGPPYTLEKEKAQRISIARRRHRTWVADPAKLPGGVKVVCSRAPDKTDPEASECLPLLVVFSRPPRATQPASESRCPTEFSASSPSEGGSAVGFHHSGLGERSSASSQPLSQPRDRPQNSATDSVRWHIETHPTHASVIDETGFCWDIHRGRTVRLPRPVNARFGPGWTAIRRSLFFSMVVPTDQRFH